MLRRAAVISIIITGFVWFIILQNYQPQNKISVAVAIIEKQGKILIAKRVGKDSWGPQWAFLGGKVERGETLHTCLVRELKEELNINANIGDYFGTHSFYLEGKEYELHAFRVTNFTGNIQLNHEHTAFAWVKPQELSNYEIISGSLPFVKQIQERMI